MAKSQGRQNKGGSSASGARTPGARTAQGKTGRQSVAAARKSNTSNRTQLLIGGVALVLIVAVIVVGLVLNKKNNVVPADGYGEAKASVATVQDGVITIAAGSPTKSIDLFEDAMCPVCGAFEHQFGQQLAQATDEGKLAVRLHPLDFLNQLSASKDYSSRAAGAMLAVATEAGSQPGLFLKFHTALFAEGTQPEENSGADLTNAQLGDVAKSVGVPDATVQAIVAGKYTDAAVQNAKAGETAIEAAVGKNWGTPTVLSNGQPVVLQSADWLTSLLAA